MSTRVFRIAGVCALSVAAVGCGSAPAIPVAHPAFTSPSGTETPAPPLVWVPEWRMYLRDGDVVERDGWYYAYRDGTWSFARSEDGPWSTIATREARRTPEAITDAGPPEVVSVRRTPRTPAVSAARVVPAALEHIGAPYRWGGADPRGFDCSGFVMYIYGKTGVSLPHGAVRQYHVGSPVSRDELLPGDIVFFDRLRHNGIYIGDGRFVHATKSGDVVKVSRLDEDWYRRRWVGARRVLPVTSLQP